MQEEMLKGYRLSPQQRQLWEALRHGWNRSYQAKCAVAVKGRLSARRLKDAVQRTIARHEILRTTFQCLPGMTIPMQVIQETGRMVWREDDLSGLDEPAPAVEAWYQELSPSFDFERGPLLYLNLIKRAEEDYVLIVCLPSICADSTGLRNLIAEFSRSYAASGSEAESLGEVAQYADLAEWQNELIESEELRSGREYWRDRERPRQPSPQLAIEDRPAGEPPFNPHCRELLLGPALTDRIESLARRVESTSEAILLALWDLLLRRQTGDPELDIGAIFDGRHVAEIEEALGLFAKCLPLDCRPEDGLPFKVFVKRIEASCLAARNWQEYFSWDQLAPSNGPVSEAALLPYCFEPPTEPAGFKTSDLSFTIFKQQACIDRFKIKLAASRGSNGLTMEFHYDSELFRPADIQVLMGHYRALLESALADPEAPLRELEMLTTVERRQLVTEYNSTRTAWPPEKLVPELFAEQVELTPEAVAVIYGDERLTYSELNQRADRLANYLRESGVGPETVVGLCLERSLDLVVGLLAILKAGGAYLPLDPSHPPARLDFMLADASVRLLLTHSELRSKLPPTAQVACFEIDAQWESLDRAPERPGELRLAPDNLAYVIYTSGSTGQPKGVMLSHGSLKNYLLWAIAHYPVNAGCGAPVHSSLGFDLTITSLFTPLLVGGYAHLMTVEREIEALGEALSSGPGYSLIKLTPAHLRLLSGMFEDFGLEGAARSMVIGGENLTAQAVQWWRERAPGVRLFNEYGPTEGTVGCCVYEVATRPDVERGRPHVPIGRPIANASLYVLDRRGAPAPQGLVGELCLGGAGLARGYLNRPELTAEKFLPSPDAGEPGGRLYRTGDLARYLRDGHLECLGRVDEQVKIRGYRIELGEIETRLADHPAIGEAAVMARETASGDKSLVAYYTSAESAAPSPPPTAEDLRAHLAATLPEYMLPAAYVKLPALPLTSNGKLDRQALPAPDRAASPSREYRPPVGEIEIALAGIWEQLLQVERVGRDDNFFALGGHSLMAVTLIERMRQAGLSGEVRALFMQPTLAALAATVNDTLAPVAVAPNRIPPACTAITLEMLPLIQLSALDLERIVSTVPGGAANVQDLYPLAPLQEGILFHHLLGNAGDLYLMRALLSFETRSRLDRYLRALQAVIERHDILRTSILWEGLPEPVQVVWREAPLTVEEIAVDPTAGDAAAQLMARYDPASYRIDISVAPLMRVGIAHDARTGRWLMLHLYHHLSIDHTTVEVLLEEVQAHLLGRAEQLPAPLPFRNVVAQTRQRENRAGHEEFFRALLGDVDEPTAPFGLTDIQGHGSSLRDARLEVDPELAIRLRRAAQSLGVSPAILYHLVWALVLARVSGRDDVVFGTVLFGRMQGREGIDRMVGIFINTLPVRIQINADSLKESLYRIQGLLIGLLRHEHAPLTLAQRCSAVAAPAPLFSALLNYRHRGAAGPRVDSAEAPLPAWEGIEFLSTEERSNYPFCLNVNDLGEGFVLHAQVASPADPDRICAYLHTALERLAEGLEQAPSTPVRNLNVLPDSERHQILVAWNATGADYPRDLCLNRLIEAQADRYRDRTAISYEEEALTYGELNARANQLAHHLKKLGVGPEVLVGLYLERSIEMVVGWLGTLKAGGAYLPLDPSYPPDRISFMLEDGRSAVILTQARLLPFLPANQAEVLCLDRDWNLIGRESRENPESEVSPAHPAYVIYTSGSTGRPKGVVIPHGAITNHMLWMQEAFPLEARDRVVQKTPFSFDASVWEFYAPLLVGGELIMARPGGHQDSAYLVRLMAEREATILQVVPSMLQLLLNESGIETCRGLKRVFCGGEALTLELQTRFRSRLGAELHNLYGPTEATIDATSWSCHPGENSATTMVPIGRPIANAEAYVLDRWLEPVPVGAAGELYLGGPGIGRGYLRRPELTAERFIPHLFGPEPGTRLYRTGDLVRYRPDGNLEFLGRKDDQIKLRGYRIELGEIERVLDQHPKIRGAAVVVREDDPGRKRLVAYLVMEAESAEELKGLRTYLKERLPDYMVPSSVVRLDKMPLTPNGKLDRKALPKPDPERTENGAAEVRAQTPVEERLIEIFREVLKLDRVGIHDNFFELGGDSILSIQIVSKANEAGLGLTPKQLFQHQSIAELAAVAAPGGPGAMTEVERGPVSGDVPLTPIQKSFFESHLHRPEHFNQSIMLEAEPGLEIEALTEVFRLLVKHHDVLRHRFHRAADGWRQVCEAPGHDLSVERVDLSTIDPGRESRTIEELAAGYQRGIDLSAGPLIRVVVFDPGPGRHPRVLIVVHHLVIDGVSWRILLNDLERGYQQAVRGEAIRFGTRTTSYQRWAERLIEEAQSERSKQEAGYWLASAGERPSGIPVDDRGINSEASSRTIVVSLSEEETEGLLQEIPKVYKAQIHEVLLGAAARAVGRWSGDPSVLIEVEGHGREEIFGGVDLTRTMGWFTVCYPVRLEASGENSAEWLRRVKEPIRESGRRGIYYGMLKYLNREPAVREQLRGWSGAEISFNYLGQLDLILSKDSRFKEAKESPGSGRSGKEQRPYLIEINGKVSGGRLRLEWTYSENIHRPETIEALAAATVAALRAAVTEARSAGERPFTPSDFPLARLDQGRLERLIGTGEDLEDLYGLSPLQKAMLFHTLSGLNSQALLIQLSCTLRGELDLPAFKQAWQRLVERHAILRTGFEQQELEHPVQMVRRNAKLPIEILDWRSIPEPRQASEFESLLAADREREFDLSNPPLMRLRLVRVAEDRYRLIWSHHHLLLDGWSAPLILQEVFSLYEGFRRGEEPSLKERTHYREYIGWLKRQDSEKAEAFWRERLKGFARPIQLWTDRGDRAIREEGFRDRQVKMCEGATARLQAAAKRAHLTINTILQGAWGLLLSRSAGEMDVVFGTTVSGRPADLPGGESIIGPLINTLPVRMKIPAQSSVGAWMSEIQRDQSEYGQYASSSLMEQYSEVPLGTPLYESILIYENYPTAGIEERRELSLEVSEVATPVRTKYPLTIVSGPGSELSISMAYDSKRLDQPTIDRLLSQLTHVIEELVGDPERPVWSVSLLSRTEQAQILARSRGAERNDGDDSLSHWRFELVAGEQSEAVAVVCGEEQLSYGELNLRSDRMAAQLTGLGVGPEVVVGIQLKATPAAAVGLLGVLKAGGSCLWLEEPEESEGWTAELLITESGGDWPLTKRTRTGDRLERQPAAIRLDLDREESRAASGVAGANLALVRSSVGSGGERNAVMLTHAGLRNQLLGMQEAIGLNRGDRVLIKGCRSVEGRIAEMLWPLQAGACLVMAKTSWEPRAWGDLINEEQVTIVSLTPSIYSLLTREGAGDRRSLKRVILSGESLNGTIANGGPGRAEPVLYNLYQVNECSGGVAVGDSGTAASPETAAIERPLPNTGVYLLDRQMEAVATGVIGEVWVDGEGLARGYAEQAELTADRFRPNRYSLRPGARLFRTGDLGRRRPDGRLEILSAGGDQIHGRGRRLEAWMIERALLAYPGIDQAAVIVEANGGGSLHVEAYVGCRDADWPSVERLRSYLRERVPSPIVPARIVRMESLRLSPDGRIDRRELPRSKALEKAEDGGPAGTWSPYEELVRGIWCELFGTATVGRDESFFELGGHSLLATQLTSRVREVLKVELPLRTVFEEPTIEGLGRRIEQAIQRGEREITPPLLGVPRTGGLPLSFAQQRLWFLDQLVPNNPFYNCPGAMRLKGRLNLEALERVINEIVRRHEILRTRFEAVDAVPVQVIDHWEPRSLEVEDLTHHAPAARAAETASILRAEAGTGFDLRRGPLMRVKVLKLEADEHIVVFTMHHIVSDRWSMGVLVREVGALYRAINEGQRSPLPELKIQYADYAQWQRNRWQGEFLERQLRYWRERLVGLAPLELPTDLPRPALANYRGASLGFQLSEELTRNLRSLSRREGRTLFMTLLATFQTLLSRYSGQEDIAVGSPIANRTRSETESLIGFFVNTLVLRTSVGAALSFRKLLAQVGDTCLGAYAHQDLPFEQLVESLQPERDLSHQPLFQAMLVLQNAPAARLEIPGLQLSYLEIPAETSKFDLLLSIEDGADRLICDLNYDCDLFEAATIERLGGHLMIMLEAVVANPESPVSAIEYLTPEERRQILEQWGALPVDYRTEPGLPVLFERQVERTPEAVAVVSEAGRLTYRELDRRANRLAHYLQARGIGPETMVGLCINRSSEMMVGLLGILKAGGAYVPLDPAYPKPHLAFMLEDTQAAIIVTEEQMRSSLPESRSSVVTLDGAGAEIARYPDTRPKTDLQPENPAYVIYTSGSTGRPKGVVIEHRNAAAFIKWAAEEFEARDLDGVLASTSICFDLSVFEIFVTLSRGGKVILAANALSLPLLSARAEVSLVNTVPSAMAELMRMRAIPDGVRIVNLAGETLHRGLAEEIYEHTRVEVVRNLYGPSEDTTYSTFEAVEQGTEVTIGRPVSGSQVYILDERMQLVPIGVAGEIYIAGAGVARGYLNRSPLTAERFAVDPFNREAGGRVYRTGDWGRYKPDGRIEYLGRIDRQVKVRGYRIELEEIERALMEHPAVSQSVVTIREDEPGDKRLVAYLVRQPNYIRGAQASPNGESSIQQVSQWQSVFDQMYDSSAASQESAFDLAGWNSSYTRSAIPDQEMREWLDETVDRILSLRSESVLEIGCGTGLILWRVAPFCRRYCGTDFSRSALDRLHHELGSQPSLSHVELFERAAENFEGFEPESFDTVIVNSVVQYFPGIDYLIEVLEQAVRHVKSGGTILIGDIRSLPLLKAFQTSVQLYQAPAALAAAELRARAQRQLEEEQELLIDPSFFLALKRHLPRIKHVDIRLKEGRHHNELTKYRYEVLIHVSDEPLALADCTWMDWQTASLSLPALEQLLSSKSQEVLAIRRIPNARLTEDRALLEMLAAANGADRVEDLRRGLHSIQEPGIDPAALIDLGRGLNYRVKINWSGSGNDWYFDVIFLRNDAGPDREMPPVVNPWWANSDGLNGSWNRYANDPLRTESTSSLVSDLRAHARHRLPEYMMPSAWMVLDELPLTPNGKVNRRALPAPEMNRTEVRQQEAAPRTPVEEMLVGIFEEVLRLKRLGVHDNFFEQGGHSLLATQVMSRIRKAFGVEIAVRSIFEDPTAAGLARRVEAARRAGATDDTPPLTKRPRGTVLPLSFAQQRLWFIEQLDPGTALYNCPGAMKLEGRLDLRILESVINEVVRRHEVLRTRIEVVDGVPAQTIDEWEPRRLELFDLTDLTAEERETEAKRIARAEFGTGFDLSKGPLIRVKVLQLKANEYVVLFTMHHIVSDGWSVGVLVKEVCLLYEALSAGHGSPLPELEIQYADYASWQRTWLQGEVLERQLGYWRAQLDGDWPMLELPIDRPRTSRHSGAGARESGTISEELTEKLVGLSRRHGGTLYMTLLGAFQILLSRYSGQHDIVVGTDIANRNRKETEELIGFFVNQLVLRTDLQGDPSFEQLLERVKNVTLNAYAHQDVPFEKLVEELQPRRDLNRSPLFQAKLVLQNAPTARTLRLPGIVLKEIESEEVRARLDLTIFITEIQNRLSMAVVYNRELFEAGTVRRLLEHFGTLLESIAEAPERRVNQLPLMTEAQRLQIVAGLNHAAEDGRFESVLAMIRESVNRCPDAIAVNYQDQFLSYRELNFRSNQLGHYLRRLGVGPEVIVAVCMKRCAEMPMALLGILKAGGIYLPMDPGYPIERLGLMLDDAGVSVIITHEQARASLPAVWVQTIGLDQEWEELSRGAGTEVPAEVAAAGAAYVIYTSGSTGRPKGVVITHGGLANYLKWAAEEYRIAAGEGAPVQSSIGFDLTVTSVYGPLVCGKRVQLLPEEAGLEALAADLSREWAYSLIKITPAHLDVLAEQMKDREVAGRAGVLVIGGEELRDEGLASWRARAPGTRLINEYGPTETVVGCCAYEVKEPGNEGEAAPIGKPITNTRMYVLDGEQEPLPIGARGELYISGAGVARGYLGAPELTAERFRPDPFGSSGGERMYRTGDEGRYLPDGNLTYLGRGDRQVKVRGYRIELGEIEAALRTHPDVKQSVVMVNEDGPGRKRLVGYVVSGGRATAAELKHHLRERIPDYMVPEAVLFLDEMPVTANGKIDRKRLSQIEIEVRSEEQEPAGSRTAIEEIVAGIFAEVLGLERGRPDDNFFENGGHSLLATQVVSRVKSAFSVELNVRAIFEEPTVAGLAHRIEAAMRGGERQDAPPLIRAPREGELFLSYAQQSLWFIEQLELGQAIYNSPTAVKLEGRLKLEILEAVINEIVKRHELLRTRIEAEAGTPKPVIDEWQPQRLEVVDLTDLTAEARTAEALRFAGLEAETGFDLSRGPLMRVKLLKLEEEQHVLLCTMHHIVSDAWSMGILVKEVCALYEAMSEGRTSPLPELEIQYADYAFWQRNFLTDAVIREHLSYWKQQLGGQLPVLRLPADHPRPPVPSYRGATIYLPVPAELQRPLQDLSRREGVTLFMLLLAAFKVLLHKYTAQEDIIVGTSAANRNRAELEPLIGYFVNMLPLRTNLGGDPRFGELLKRVREVALGGYAHHELPFEKLVEEIQPERAVRQMPLFNVAFGVQNAPRAELRLPDLKLSPVLAADAGARFDLALWVTEGPEGMQISWIYSRDLFKEVTVKRMHDHFMNLLFGIVDRPDARLTTLDLTPGAETGPTAEASSRETDFDPQGPRTINRRGIKISGR